MYYLKEKSESDFIIIFLSLVAYYVKCLMILSSHNFISEFSEVERTMNIHLNTL